MLTLFSLFLGAFFAATLLPFSSEAMLVAALKASEFDHWVLILIATLGNTLGAIVNWALGRYLLHWTDRKWFPFTSQQLDKSSKNFNRFGIWTLLFSWIPVVGDPLTFAAGVLKVSFSVFLPLVVIGKCARYIFVALAFQ